MGIFPRFFADFVLMPGGFAFLVVILVTANVVLPSYRCCVTGGTFCGLGPVVFRLSSFGEVIMTALMSQPFL